MQKGSRKEGGLLPEGRPRTVAGTPRARDDSPQVQAPSAERLLEARGSQGGLHRLVPVERSRQETHSECGGAWGGVDEHSTGELRPDLTRGCWLSASGKRYEMRKRRVSSTRMCVAASWNSFSKTRSITWSRDEGLWVARWPSTL